MTGWILAAVLGCIVLAVFVSQGSKLQASLARSGRSVGIAWILVSMVIGLGVGTMAARWYWQTIPKGDFSFGGMVFGLFALGVFFLGCGVGVAVVLWARTALGPAGRMAIVGGLLVALVAGLLLPMQHEATQAKIRNSEMELAQFESNLANLQATLATIPHAPPDVVPPMLAVQRQGNDLLVTNNSAQVIRLRVALVLPQGPQWERCNAGVDMPCTMTSGGCPSAMTKEGTRVLVTTARSIELDPLIRTAASKTFTARCDARFTGAQVEYHVQHPGDYHTLFKSESAFVPDHPQLWRAGQ